MIKLLKNFTIKEWLIVLLCVLLTCINVSLELRIPDYMSDITRLIQSTGDNITNEIIKTGGLRSKIFNKVESFGDSEVKKFSTASLITRTTNDVTQIEMLIAMGLHMMLRAPIMSIFAVSKIIGKSFEWSMLTAGCVTLLLSVVISMMIIVVPRFKHIQKLIDKVNGVTRENVTGIRVIRAFNAEQFQSNRFEVVNDDLTNNQLFNQRVFSIMGPVMNLVMHALTFGIYVIGAYLIYNAAMMDKINIFSNMVVFTSYGMHVIMSFLFLAVIFMMAPRAAISANRINEVLDEDILIKEGRFEGKTRESGTIEFKNVTFKYPDADENILEDISFKVEKGETVAFIGSTGSGKSTLINLIPRFYDVTKGEILVDGVNVKDYTFEALNNRLGYVPQKAVMFTCTVEENVKYGKSLNKITIDEVREACKIAQAEDFISEMDDEYYSHVARGGTNLSGGQKQRLSIARAIARKPEIYIFDDTFSALDYKTDSILRNELKRYTKDATSLIVAQRIGTIMHADKIIVLDDGKCVGIGTHKELLKKCKVYKEIALSQLSEEELKNA